MIHAAPRLSRLALLCAIFGVASGAYAQEQPEDSALQDFTRSITDMYVTSAKCQQTIHHGPGEYMDLIRHYFDALYPNGTAYWALPENVQPITDQNHCIVALQRSMMAYRAARDEYEEQYPDVAVPPPVLVAYEWEKTRPIVKPAPAASYQPTSKKPTLSKGFGGE